ncbi:hypothetical protein PBSA08_019 [Staphylococcus phage PBSA08]|nr:hypothetical protein PBSA08_019 [Staphylococcus phage PBSA08]
MINMKNLYKILTGVFFSTTLLLGGCAYYSQEDTPTHDYKEDKKENKKENKKDGSSKVEEQENKQIQEDNTVQNNQQDNQVQGNQAQQNEQMQEASRSEHNGLSNAEYADKYNQYREAQQAQAELENRTEVDKASGGGGGGASWNYAGANESFEQWLQRSQQEKAEAGVQAN